MYPIKRSKHLETFWVTKKKRTNRRTETTGKKREYDSARRNIARFKQNMKNREK